MKNHCFKDTFPEPPGYTTDGTTQAQPYEVTAFSGVNPYNAEVSFQKLEELPAGRPITAHDFLEFSSALDDDLRYIRKAYIESISPHKRGSIIRTFSGDFHVAKQTRQEIMRRLGSLVEYSWEKTERQMLMTEVRQAREETERLKQLVVELAGVNHLKLP